MKNKKLLSLMIIGSVLGAIFAFISLYEHVELVNDLKISPSFCNISDAFNCDKVNESKFAEFIGVPIASFGILYYLVMFFWTIYFYKSKKLKDNVYSNTCLVLSTCAVLYSIALFCVSQFIIKTLCLNCMAMYAANFLQWFVALMFDRKTSITKRFIDGVIALINFPLIVLGISGKSKHILRKDAIISSVSGVLLGAFLLFLPDNILLPKIKSNYNKSQLLKENYQSHHKGFYNWIDEPVQDIALNATKNLDGVYYEGNKDAPIKIVEYADLQCPACRVYYNLSKNFLKKYEGKVLFVYKHFPLDSKCNSMIKGDYHKYACFASLFSLCAGEQGKYWEAMDSVYSMPTLIKNESDALVKEEFKQIALELGLDEVAFKECLEAKRYSDKLASDIEEAKALNIPGTPFVFINGKLLKNRGEVIMEEIFNYILSYEN